MSLIKAIERERKVDVKGCEVSSQQDDKSVDQGDPCGQPGLHLGAAEQRCNHPRHTAAQEHSSRVDAGKPGSKTKNTGCMDPTKDEVEEEQEEEEVGVKAGHH